MDGWQIEDETTFGPSVLGCGGFELIDSALEIIEYGLHVNPYGFEEVPGFAGIRIAKTKLMVVSGNIVPALTLWFKVDEVNRIVTKLYVEMTDPLDMRLWERGDDNPF
jgi:hypothetical protein